MWTSATGPKLGRLALLSRLEAASGPRRPAGVPGIRSTFQRSSKKNKGEARGTQGRCLPAFEFFRSPAYPKPCLHLTGQKLVQCPYLGAAELGTGISKQRTAAPFKGKVKVL